MKKLALFSLILLTTLVSGVKNTPVFADSTSNTQTEIITFTDNQNQYNFGNLESFAVNDNYIYLANDKFEIFNKSNKSVTLLNYPNVTDIKQTSNYVLFKSNGTLKVLKNNVEQSIENFGNLLCDKYNVHEYGNSLYISYATGNTITILRIEENSIVDRHTTTIQNADSINSICLNKDFTYAIFENNTNYSFVKIHNSTVTCSYPTFSYLNCANLELLEIGQNIYFILTHGYNLNGQNTNVTILKENSNQFEEVTQKQSMGIAGTSVAIGEISSIADVKVFNQKIYIADYTNKAIQCFKLKDNTLQPTGIELTSSSIEKGYFYDVNDLTVVNDNTFLIADSKNNRLQTIVNNNITIKNNFNAENLVKPTIYTTTNNMDFAFYYDKYLVRYNDYENISSILNIGYDVSDLKLDTNNNAYYVDYSTNTFNMIENGKGIINVIIDNIEVDNLSNVVLLNKNYAAVHHNKSVYLIDIVNKQITQTKILVEQISSISADYYGNVYAITASGIQKLNLTNGALETAELLSYNTKNLSIIEINKVNGNIYCYNNSNNNIIKITKNGFVDTLENFNHSVDTNTITPKTTIISSAKTKAICYVYDYPNNVSPNLQLAENTNVMLLNELENSYFVMYNKANKIHYGYINKKYLDVITPEIKNIEIVLTVNKNVKLYTLPTILPDVNDKSFEYKTTQFNEQLFVVNFALISLDNSQYYAIKNGDNILYVNSSDVTLQDTQEIKSLPDLNAQIIIAENKKVMLLAAPTDKSLLLQELSNNQKLYVKDFNTNNKYTYVTIITEDKTTISGYVETKYIKLIEDNPNMTSAYVLLAISILIATASVIIFVKQKRSSN